MNFDLTDETVKMVLANPKIDEVAKELGVSSGQLKEAIKDRFCHFLYESYGTAVRETLTAREKGFSAKLQKELAERVTRDLKEDLGDTKWYFPQAKVARQRWKERLVAMAPDKKEIDYSHLLKNEEEEEELLPLTLDLRVAAKAASERVLMLSEQTAYDILAGNDYDRCEAYQRLGLIRKSLDLKMSYKEVVMLLAIPGAVTGEIK